MYTSIFYKIALKKLSSIPLILAITFTLLFVQTNQAKAYEEIVDQKNTVISQGAATIASYGHNQTFTAGKDMLTKVQIFMKDRREGSNVTLEVTKLSTGNQILQSAHRMGSGSGWEIFNLGNNDSQGYKLEKGQEYVIWITTNYYTQDPVPKWVRSSTDSYAAGIRRQNSTPYPDDDFAFATYGYDLVTGEDTTPPDEPQDNTPVIEVVEEQGSNEPQIAEDIDTADGEEINLISGESSIEPPILDYVIYSNDRYEGPVKDLELNENQGNTLFVFGKAIPGYTIVLKVKNDKYLTYADNTGNWQIEINATDLESGMINVIAKSQVDFQSSDEIKLFDFKIGEQDIDATMVIDSMETDGPNSLVVFAGVLFMLLIGLLIGVLSYLYYKKNN